MVVFLNCQLNTMKIALLLMMFVHGLIHLLGFVKAYNLTPILHFTQSVSKTNGVLWLIVTLLFILTSALLLSNIDWWWIVAAIAIFISQYLIFTGWNDAKFGTIANVIFLIATVIGYGTWSYKTLYYREVTMGLQQTAAISDTLLTESDISPLPEPVRKYLRFAGVVGKPKVRNFRVEFTGQIRKNEQSEWMPFTSEQYNFLGASTRLFFMKAIMKQLPVAGFHSFRNGNAFMDIRLLSLFKVQYATGAEMGIAETVTFFNDMCCMAPATLIDKRIQWLETGNNKVKAQFSNNGITISAWLYFSEKGELTNFVSDDRFALTEENTMKQFRWSTPLQEYKQMNGYTLAGYADAIYSYPTGDVVYGNFRLTNVEYNCKGYEVSRIFFD